jgi:alkylation response protein AidB-like acyl-CoA dehydrogenase
MESKVAPIINKYWIEDAFPFELLPAVKELNIGGLNVESYSSKLKGMVAMEMSRIDPSFTTFFGVHTGLAMGSIALLGSQEQKQKWLPPMARMEKIGCFALTEPLVGSGTGGGLTTTAKREGDTWILNGEKKRIGNAPWCDVSIIWARDVADNQVKGFIVENKTTPGFSVRWPRGALRERTGCRRGNPRRRYACPRPRLGQHVIRHPFALQEYVNLDLGFQLVIEVVMHLLDEVDVAKFFEDDLDVGHLPLP